MDSPELNGKARLQRLRFLTLALFTSLIGGLSGSWFMMWRLQQRRQATEINQGLPANSSGNAVSTSTAGTTQHQPELNPNQPKTSNSPPAAIAKNSTSEALEAEPQDTATPDKVIGTAELEPIAPSAASGVVTFTHAAAALRVEAHVQGAGMGEHGIFILAANTCRDFWQRPIIPLHLNPFDEPHGTPNNWGSHVGDLGNIDIGRDGRGEHLIYLEESFFPVWRFSGWQIILGRAVAVTLNQDDFMTQPTGNSGPMIACGIIKPPSLKGKTSP